MVMTKKHNTTLIKVLVAGIDRLLFFNTGAYPRVLAPTFVQAQVDGIGRTIGAVGTFRTTGRRRFSQNGRNVPQTA